MSFLVKILDYSLHNKLNAIRLAQIFAPIFFRPKSGALNKDKAIKLSILIFEQPQVILLYFSLFTFLFIFYLKFFQFKIYFFIIIIKLFYFILFYLSQFFIFKYFLFKYFLLFFIFYLLFFLFFRFFLNWLP